VFLRDIHSNLLTQYDCKEVCVTSQSQVNLGAGAGPNSPSKVNMGTGPPPSSIPQLNRLVEASLYGMRVLSPKH
jgi:hypothetical protein